MATVPNRQITNTDEWQTFVEQFVTLLDKEMSKHEEKIKEPSYAVDLVHVMPALISMVNTIGYLRGQDGMIASDMDPNIRIPLTNKIREYENHFEERLDKLIDIILKSDQKEYYEQRLDSYFTKCRTKQKTTVAW